MNEQANNWFIEELARLVKGIGSALEKWAKMRKGAPIPEQKAEQKTEAKG